MQKKKRKFLRKNIKPIIALVLCLITTAVLAAGRCVPCKLNHYCVDGLRYQCPSTAPVTQTTGTDSLDGCLTCVQRNGNEGNPIYDDLVGDCVSCVEYDSATPIWNGSECVSCYEYENSTPIWDGNTCIACAAGTSFNEETGVCEISIIEISNPEELAKIGVDANYPLSGSYVLTADINVWEITTSIPGPFTGKINGGGHQISNLTVPLFNTLSGATITSLDLRNVNISDVCGRVGAFAEEVYGTTFENCSVEGNIYSASSCSTYYAGAFVGACYYAENTFEACSSDVYINDEEQANFCGYAGLAD